MAEGIGVARFAARVNTTGGGHIHLCDIGEEVAVDVHLDAGGVEEPHEAHAVIFEIAGRVSAAVHVVHNGEVVVIRNQVVLVDIHHRIVGEAPNAASHVTVIPVATFNVIEGDVKDGLIRGGIPVDGTREIELGIELHVDFAGDVIIGLWLLLASDA